MALRHQLLAMFQTYLNKKEPFRPGVIISENFRDPLESCLEYVFHQPYGERLLHCGVFTRNSAHMSMPTKFLSMLENTMPSFMLRSIPMVCIRLCREPEFRLKP